MGILTWCIFEGFSCIKFYVCFSNKIILILCCMQLTGYFFLFL